MNTNLAIPRTAVLPQRSEVNPFRKIPLTAGLLYILTFICIPTLTLYGPVHQPNYITRPANNTPVIIGGLLEI